MWQSKYAFVIPYEYLRMVINPRKQDLFKLEILYVYRSSCNTRQHGSTADINTASSSGATVGGGGGGGAYCIAEPKPSNRTSLPCLTRTMPVKTTKRFCVPSKAVCTVYWSLSVAQGHLHNICHCHR
jgi:hypothetical protein